MAGRSKTATLPIGSSQWIQAERDQGQQFHDVEVDEFSYAARNELDWLNEHMAEIFSRDQRNFADVFKTPGKLRGKTPMTGRKRDPLVARAPLGDLFAPNPQSTLSPGPNNAFYNKVAQFKVAEDQEERSPRKGSSRKSPMRVGKETTDSGYHGITEDEMELDSQQHQQQANTQSTFANPSFVQPLAVEPALETLDEHLHPEARPANDDESFVSANEDVDKAKANTQETDDATVPDEEMHAMVDDQDEEEEDGQDGPSSPMQEEAVEEEEQGRHIGSANWQVEADENDDDEIYDEDIENQPEVIDDDDNEDMDAKSASDTSTPAKTIVRKSSLTFAALPAREPLKRSIGARTSHIDAYGRSSVHAKSFRVSQQPTHSHSEQEKEEIEIAEDVETHNKTSTQRLHDRIAALGQSKDPRPSRSITSQHNDLAYPVLPKDDNDQNDQSQPLHDDDDDDWIAPIKTTSRGGSGADLSWTQHQKPEDTRPEDRRPSVTESVLSVPAPTQSPLRHPLGHQKSFSTITLTSPAKLAALAPQTLHKKASSVSNPNMAHAAGVVHSTTPTSSPGGRRFADAPLSASKAKLYSVLKSAKGMFASSASTSAQAKLDSLHSPSRPKLLSHESEPSDVYRIPGGFDIPLAPKPAERPADGRRTRSSTESDRKAREEQKSAVDALEQARQKERQKAAEQKEERERAKTSNLGIQRPATASRLDSQRTVTEDTSETDDMPPPPPPKSMIPPGKLRAPGRLVRPTRPATAPQQKPAPVNIKIASQSQRLGSTQPPERSVEPTPPPTATRTRAGSVQGRSNPTSTARVRALEAAARKKEQDEKAAQRKADQKKELERKRAAKAEEERRAEEERKAAEQKRVREERLAEQRRIQEARATAQRQAEQRKLDEQRLHAAQEKARAEQLAAALEQEKQEKQRAQANYPRGDIQGTLRQLAQKEIPRPAVSAKTSKRALGEQDDDSQQRPGVQRGLASYQQQDNKRRKTLEEDEDPHERHSVMAPPKRPSNMRKNTQETFNKFPNGYSHAPPPAAHHTSGMNMYKATVTTQHQLQHAKAPMHPNDMLKLSTARIPFADNTNPPGPSNNQYSQDGPSAPSSSKPSAFKTPGRPASAMPKSVIKSAKSAARSSPMYANGENIALPEIATDSEDESDSDDEGPSNGGFRAPSWVASPALRDLLTQQQLVDPESVFGPIAPLHMDEVFKGTKADRIKRFRDRGSSARWVETGDAVTQEEKKKDQEMRSKMFKDGGWSYQQ